MAYSLGARFPPAPKYFTLLDPGAYQSERRGVKKNVAPFLSRKPRNTHPGAKLWTQAVYNQNVPHKIVNCSSMLSTQPRFPYEAFSAEDLEEILCKCGILSPCECPSSKEQEPEDVICQGKVKRRIFKGPTPRSILGDEGLSTPSRNDHGFNVLADGSQQRMKEEEKEECPPFYDARVNEATAFYQGCKWSQWTSKRVPKSLEVRPGPADYSFERDLTQDEICAEKVRAFKRKTSKQLRYIEMIQEKNIFEDQPGPASYNPILPKGTELQYLGSKAKRFPTALYEVSPSPADHWIRRDFDPIEPPDIPCHADLPEPPCFGMKAKRFKNQREEGPSPATYNVNYRVCQFIQCPTAPFGTSAERFKKEIIEDSDEEDIMEKEQQNGNEGNAEDEPCPKLSWEFKSKSIRMKPLVKKNDEPSPADFPQPRTKVQRSSQSQYVAPFFSSAGRFRPWYNWIPVHGNFKTPGPAEYSAEKPKCPAFIRSPLYSAERFPSSVHQSPAPNEYKVNDGIETILATHNQRLKNNIENQYKFIWKPPVEQKNLTFEEQEAFLLQKAISLLDSDDLEAEQKPLKLDESLIKKDSVASDDTKKPKMLRTFLYARPLPKYL